MLSCGSLRICLFMIELDAERKVVGSLWYSIDFSPAVSDNHLVNHVASTPGTKRTQDVPMGN